MELLEYQAKELFREVGIPVLPSQKIAEPRELKKLQIHHKKSQMKKRKNQDRKKLLN
jgi:succinyl-CoA synthetase beta subunit